jgi:hypothetical protein
MVDFFGGKLVAEPEPKVIEKIIGRTEAIEPTQARRKSPPLRT